MLNDLMMDVTLQSHHEIARSRTICCICHTLFVAPDPLFGLLVWGAYPHAPFAQL